MFDFHDLHTLLLSSDDWQPQKNRRIIPLFLSDATQCMLDLDQPKALIAEK
ncbi:hypothetical protein SPAB_00448 [Salmonella enterica subsp. enterica serovar Paratyphi B str. SPB7]|uniref:Uncharacterized protein n=1 Tax=Salmonella paratyphi B (strain ATCC BAA-1250 / SPB7) TaxID=1016998 RepID=A0A6C6YYF5_SALPB|nr:hypothetical protein SPAB_00448 [Salmonella enterica subsp. enterica serovar Paratyphi B str. SPB7]